MKNEASFNEEHLIDIISNTDTGIEPTSQSSIRRNYSIVREYNGPFSCSALNAFSNNNVYNTVEYDIDAHFIKGTLAKFDGVYCLDVLSDGRIVCAKSVKGPIFIYDLVKQTTTVSTQNEHILDLIVLRGDIIVTQVCRNGRIFVCFWDPNKLNIISEFKLSDQLHALLALQNGGFMACDEFEILSVWDVKDGLLEYSETQSHWIADTTALCELHDGTIAIGDAQGKIHFWDPKAENSEKVLHGHKLSINSLHTLSDGRLVSTSKEVICVWNMTTNTCDEKLSLGLTDISKSIVMPDDRIVAVTNDGKLRIWG